MKKLLLFVLMILPVSIFGLQDSHDTIENKDCLCTEICQNGPIVNLDVNLDNESNLEDCVERTDCTDCNTGCTDESSKDLDITFNCSRNEIEATVGSLKTFEEEKIEEICSEIQKAKDALASDIVQLEELIDTKNGWLQRFETINFIVNGDVENLKNLAAERFEQDFSVETDGSKLENNLDGRLVSHYISGDNMLAWVLFKSATNKTEQDDEKTLQMLRIILDSGVDVNSKAERLYLVKNSANEIENEFVSELPLVELAILYSFPKTVELLLEYGAKFIKRRVDFCMYSRIISELANCFTKNGMPKDKLAKTKLMFANFIEVLGVINFDLIAKDRDDRDSFCEFDNMFCKYWSQSCQEYDEL